MQQWMGCSKTISWLTSADSDATSLTHTGEIPVLPGKKRDTLAFQSPASALQAPCMLCTNPYLAQSGGNLKFSNSCLREEPTHGNFLFSGADVEEAATGNSGSSIYFWAILNCNNPPYPNSVQPELNGKY